MPFNCRVGFFFFVVTVRAITHRPFFFTSALIQTKESK